MHYFISILFGAFFLENLAIAYSAILILRHKISMTEAFWACFLGLTLSDLALYSFGQIIARYKLADRWQFLKNRQYLLAQMKQLKKMTYSISLSRFTSGSRLPTYLGAGFLNYAFWDFFILTISSVFVWVMLALFSGQMILKGITRKWPYNFLFLLLAFYFLKKLISKMSNRWDRKALLHIHRRWLAFEYWPEWLFYLPLVPYYLYLSIKHKSPFTPLYANPHVANGGLIGESKWEFIRHLNSGSSSTLQSFRIGKNPQIEKVQFLIEEENFDYPFIIKPDVGQRGYGVRIIRNVADLSEYLQNSPFDKIIQKFSSLPHEAGLFYIRRPHEPKGRIFSITEKHFPVVIGDGKTQLGDLILKDKRARIINDIYFRRFKERLYSVPADQEVVHLTECGDHCQGAICVNGSTSISDALVQEIDHLAKKIPDFYFGRFDLRYRDATSLQEGHSFEIVEIYGAGAEASHIWDNKTRLIDAYKTLFKQWEFLFQIGSDVRKIYPNQKIHVGAFLKECFRVYFRKEHLSSSS